MKKLFTWVFVNEETGEEGVGCVETAGGTKIPLQAERKKDALMFAPVVKSVTTDMGIRAKLLEWNDPIEIEVELEGL